VRLSLRWKIVGGFGLLLLLIVLLGWVTLSLFGSLRSVQRKVFDEAIPQTISVDEIVRSYTAQSAAVRGFLIGSQSALLEQYQTEVATADVWQERAQELFQEGEAKKDLEDLIEAGDAFHDLVDSQVIPLAEDGKRSQAFRVLGQEGTPLISEIETLGSLLRASQDEIVAQSESQVRSRSNQTIVILVLVIAAAFAIGMFVAITLPRRLVANLQRLVEAARAIGRGDFNQRLDIKSGDEVEELAQRFGEMQSGLKRLQQLALQDRELEIAASIQRNLLQRRLPDPGTVKLVPLQRQANLVGGDWYDVDLSGRSVTVVVGDASGKGIAAALMATVTLSALRGERARGADPRSIVERANQALKDVTDPDSFTTLVYATIDIDTGEVRWLNMGHPSPFLLRAKNGGDSERQRGYYLEGPRNRALGWFDDPGLMENVAQLEAGDRLILYTDGFLEAKSPDGEVFGDHRFAQHLVDLAPLESEAIGERLVERVEEYAAGKLEDDLTMLVVEFVGPAV
jgi:serine phosphatase RsbU (regulator of sigma subunit)/CHASE3 domain sensor protein